MTYIYIATLILIAVTAIAIVLYDGYRETFGQCVGLTLIAIGSAAEARSTLMGVTSSAAFWTLVAGLVILATATRARRVARCNRKCLPSRPPQDWNSHV